MASFKYYIQLSDGTHMHTFDVVQDETELPYSIHYYIGLAHKACLHIEVNVRGKYAVLQGVQTDSECSMEGDFEVIHLLVKGALKHVAKKHSIKYYSLEDKTEKHLGNGKSTLITPRLLLQGKEGWYQKYFGAMPTQDTFRILQSLEKHAEKIKRFLPTTTAANWESNEEIREVAERVVPPYALAIFSTSWLIQRDIVDAYNVKVEELQYGGGKPKPRWIVSKWYLDKIRMRPFRRIRR